MNTSGRQVRFLGIALMALLSVLVGGYVSWKSKQTKKSVSPQVSYKKVLPFHIEVVQETNDYFYAFCFQQFRGKLYVFLSDVVGQNSGDVKKPLVESLAADGASFNREVEIAAAFPGDQVRGVYNDSDERLFVVTRHGDRDGGGIFVSEDMHSFHKVYSNEGFSVRSLIKYRSVYVAGTDGGGRLIASKDGKTWDFYYKTDFLTQLNAMTVFRGWLYLVDNSGIYRTQNFINFEQVFVPNKTDHQIYAVYASTDVLYIGSGWNPASKDNGQTNLYSTYDGVSWTHMAVFKESPMMYFILPENDSATDILWGGYASGGIYQYNATTGENSLAYKLPGQSIYSAAQFNGDLYFGSYGSPLTLLKHKMRPIKKPRRVMDAIVGTHK